MQIYFRIHSTDANHVSVTMVGPPWTRPTVHLTQVVTGFESRKGEDTTTVDGACPDFYHASQAVGLHVSGAAYVIPGRIQLQAGETVPGGAGKGGGQVGLCKQNKTTNSAQLTHCIQTHYTIPLPPMPTVYLGCLDPRCGLPVPLHHGVADAILRSA